MTYLDKSYLDKCRKNFLTWNNDIKLIREKNNNRKRELLEILKITDNNYTVYELEKLLNKQKYLKEAEQREKDRLKERQLKLRDLGMSINSEIDDDELENMFIKRLELRKRLQKQTDEFNKQIQPLNLYDQDIPFNKEDQPLNLYDQHIPFNKEDQLLYNPGGATIYTKSNAQNTMVYNYETGIYEPQL